MKQLATALLVISGYIILILVDWKIAVGVFLIHWSINVSSLKE